MNNTPVASNSSDCKDRCLLKENYEYDYDFFGNKNGTSQVKYETYKTHCCYFTYDGIK